MNRPRAVPLTWPEQPVSASAMPQTAATRKALIFYLSERQPLSNNKARRSGPCPSPGPRLFGLGDQGTAYQVRVAHMLDELLHLPRGRRGQQADDDNGDHPQRQAEHAGRN